MNTKINGGIMTEHTNNWTKAGVFIRNLGWLGAVAACTTSGVFSVQAGLHRHGNWFKVLLFAGLLTLIGFAAPALWKFFTQDKEA